MHRGVPYLPLGAAVAVLTAMAIMASSFQGLAVR